MRAALALAAGAVLSALPLWAADTFPEIEYVTGKAGFNQKVKGFLMVDEKEVRFNDKKGANIFVIPIENVVEATRSREHEEGSFGRKMALGIFASKSAEYLRVETKSAEGAEVLVFKTKKEKSPGIAAKINFQRDAKKSAAPPAP
jgi:hypothetical protein